MLETRNDVDELRGLGRNLGAEVEAVDDLSVATGLRELVDALEAHDQEHLQRWAETDLQQLADSSEMVDEAVAADPRLRRLDVARSGLIFAPIAVTWLGIALAARAYGSLPQDEPRYQDASFIALWENNFDGRGGFSLSLFHIGLIDFVLIVGLIVATLLASSKQRTLESAAASHAMRIRQVLSQIQRALVPYRYHGVARFQAELTGAAGQLRALAAEAALSSSASRDVLTAGVETVDQIRSVAEQQGAGVESLDGRMREISATVDRLVVAQESYARTTQSEADDVRSAAASAEAIAREASVASTALESGLHQLAGAIAQVDAIVSGSGAAVRAAAERMSEDQSAQTALAKNISSAAKQLGKIELAADKLGSVVGSFEQTMNAFERSLSSAATTVPASIGAVAQELSEASTLLGQTTREHGQVVAQVRATAASMEVSLAQVREDLLALVDLLQGVHSLANPLAGAGER